MLNPQQMAAVRTVDAPLLVLAGAGSGKTRVITQKIAWLIQSCGYLPRQIVAVTFTNKAANEMRKRIAAILSQEKRRGLKIATFHTLGLQIIKRNPECCGLSQGFSIFDSEDCLQLIRGLLPAGKGADREGLMSIQQQISRWKNELLDCEPVERQDNCSAENMAIYARYQQLLQAYNAVDFDDLIRLPVRLLRTEADARSHWQTKIRHLLIDEYQDSSTSQYELVKLLVGDAARFTVVGDDDQSIYAWRGARPENLAQLQKDYPRLQVIKLEQNYRSTARILQTANALIANNPHVLNKQLWSDLGHGEPIRVLCCKDEQQEAEQVVADLISHKLRHGRVYSDYAILYRGNHQSRVFEKNLRDHGIAYKLSGGQSWFARAEIKDIFAYLKLLASDKDDAAFLRAINTPKRGIGEVSLVSLGRYARSVEQSLYRCADHMALSTWLTDTPRRQLTQFKQWIEGFRQKTRSAGAGMKICLREMVEESGYEAFVYEQCDTPAQAQKRMDNIWELLDWIERLLTKKPENTLLDVINQLILIDIMEEAEEADKDTLQLSTLHASKGLEFPYVYLAGMEEGLLPHRVSLEDSQIEEERRLAYVGITRAQKGLCLTLAKRRKRAGEWYITEPSRFLDELPDEHLEWFGRHEQPNEARAKGIAQSHLAGLKNLLGSSSREALLP